MKTLNDYIVNESLSRKLTNNDKTNFATIADELDKITGDISDWMEENAENEDSDTAALAHLLSNVAAQLRGEWSDEIVFNF